MCLLRRILPIFLVLPAIAQMPSVSGAQSSSVQAAQLAAPTELLDTFSGALRLRPLLDRLEALRKSGQENSLDAISVRQQLLERVLAASFEVDAALARIDNEASYVSEKRYLVDQKAQRRATTLNLITFAASGALGAAGSAMQLTHGLNHAGTALQAASGGTSLILTGVQLRSGGGRQAIDSPYNMLAQILDRPANALSGYPPVVMSYMAAPHADGRSTNEALTAAWRRLGRLKEDPKKNSTEVDDLVADRASGRKLTEEELADREAMLHDLHSVIATLHAGLEQVVQQIELSHTPETP